MSAEPVLGQACPAGWTNPSVCLVTQIQNVYKPGCATANTTIQAAVNALATNVTGGNACVVIRDTQTYSEQVTIQGFTNNGNRVEILLDPSLSSGPVVNPPAKSTAAFQIFNASVTIGGGIVIQSTNSVSYGILVSSAYVNISSVSVWDTNNYTTQAGIKLSSSMAVVSNSSVAVMSSHGLWVTGMLNAVNYSTAAVLNSANFYALYVNGASSNTFTVFLASDTMGHAANFSGSANFNTVTLSTFVSAGLDQSALYLDASSNTIKTTYISNPRGYGANLTANAVFNTISQSTMISNNANDMAAYLNGCSTNTITTSYIFNASNDGIAVVSGAGYNTIKFSTITSSAGGTASAAYINSSSNTFTQDYISNFSGACLSMDASASQNTVSVSTLAGGAVTNACLNFTNDSYNTVKQSFVLVPGGGVTLTNSVFDTISQSTVAETSNCGGYPLVFSNASSNTVTQSYIDMSLCSDPAHIYGGSAYNTISFSTMVAGAGNMDIRDSSWNVCRNCMVIANASGATLDIGSTNGPASVFNTIINSTFTNTGTGQGIFIIGASSNTISNSYVQGSTAVWITGGSSGTVLNGNTLVATQSDGGGVWLDNLGNVNLSMSSNVITGGPSGAGVYLDQNSKGSIYITTNAFSGSQYGIFIATETNAPQIYITSNTIVSTLAATSNTYGIYINGLQTGATIQNNSIVNRQSGGGLNTYYGLYGQSVKGLNIDHNRISNPGMVISGTAVEAYFTGAQQVAFKFNDVFSTGTGFTNAYLVQLVASTVTIRDNIFFSSFGVTGSSASFKADAKSGFNSDWNTWFSSNSISNTATWGGKSYALGASWVNSSIAADANSKFGKADATSNNNPFWFNPSAGVEDFHPRSTANRCTAPVGDYASACTSWATDSVQSVTIDAADLSEGVGQEPNNPSNGDKPNQGSTGRTGQASQTPNCATWTNPSACFAGYVINVSKVYACADATTIQGGVKLLPGNISAGNACVVIRDTQTYSEQVNIPDISMSSYTIGNNQIEILIDPSLSSGPWVNAPNSATKISTAGFVITQASVTIGGGILVLSTNTVSYGIYASSAYVTISSISVQDGSGTNSKITQAGISISSWSTVSYSSVSIKNAYGFTVVGASNTVSYSSAAINNANFYALYLNDVSSNTFTVFLASNPAGPAVDLDQGASYNTITQSFIAGGSGDGIDIQNGAGYNTISFSTIASNTSVVTIAGALFVNSSSNTVDHDYIANSQGQCVWFEKSSQNVIRFSTAAGGVNVIDPCIQFNQDSYDTITQSFLRGPGNVAFMSSTVFDTISQSTVVVLSNNGSPIVLSESSSNTITQSYIDSTLNTNAVLINDAFGTGSNYNTISFSTISAAVVGIEIRSSGWNVCQNCMIMSNSNTPHDGAIQIHVGTVGGVISNYNTVVQSTITNVGGAEAVVLNGVSTNTFSNCYIQGSTAVYIAGGSSGTVLGGNTLVATQVDGSGIWLDPTATNLNVTVTSNVITGGASGSGIRIDKNNGAIYLTTNTILSGAQYGIFIATQTTGTRVYITSNTIVSTAASANNVYGIYLNGLTTGATIQNNSIVNRQSGGGPNTYYGLYGQSVTGLNIDHNRISNPGMVISGTAVEAYFTGASQVSFKFNDVFSTGTSLTNAYLIQLVASTVTIRDNIFFSSFGVTGSSASFTADAASGFNSDYNTWFSSNGQNTGVWGQGSGAAHTLGANWVTSSISADANSLFGKADATKGNNPFWANPSAGTEDFHPMTKAPSGRYDMGTGAFDLSDNVTSLTIDAADPAEDVTADLGLGLEPSPNGGRANQGSYGLTAQASKSVGADALCTTIKNVCKSGCAYSTIQAGVNALGATLSNYSCVVIRDAQTYSEQVTVQNIASGTNFSTMTIMSDPALAAYPTVNAPNSATKASTAAFQIINSSVNIFAINILSTNTVSYGVLVSSAYVTISSISVQDGSGTNSKITQAGISISSWSTVSYSSVSVQAAHGFYLQGSTATAVSYSSAAVNNVNFYGLYLNNASSNTFTVFTSSNNSGTAVYINGGSSNTITRSFITGGLGDGIRVFNGAGYNTISFSTMTSNNNANPGGAVYINSSSNTFTQDYFAGYNAFCFDMEPGASQNTISYSTAAGGGNGACINGNTDSYDTITHSFIRGDGSSGIVLGFSVFDTISFSTMAESQNSGNPVVLTDASSNTITQSYLDSTPGTDGLHFFTGSTYNTISFSTIAAASEGLEIKNSQWNVMANCMVTSNNNINFSALDINIAGGGTGLSSFNTISQSTLTNTGGGYSAFVSGSSSNTISNSYVQGSTAVWITGGSSGTVLGGNTLVATQVDGGGVWLDSQGNVNLSMSSNVITGGSSGAGVYIDKSNKGSIYLSTNTILAGAQFGIYITTQTNAPNIYITSNTIIPTLSASATTYGIYLNGLTTGATIQNNSIVYRNSASISPVTSFGLYGQSVTGLNIDHNRISNPGMVTGGNQVDAYFAGASQVAFKFNDVFSTGTGFTNAYLIQLVSNSTITLRDNIFFSSFGVTGSSASFTADKQSGFNSDWNLWFSSNGQNTGVWGQGSGAAHTLGANWVTSSISADANSKFGDAAGTSGPKANNPFWANPSAGVEDFHPMTTVANGRFNFDGTFANPSGDGVKSVSIDAADTGEPRSSNVYLPPNFLGKEPSPDGGQANMGSYGQTDQASIGITCPTWTRPAACSATAGYVKNVAKAANIPASCADASTIQGAVRLLPGNISAGNACVVIRDTQTYSEQVNIPDISMSSYTVGNNQIEILIDPSLSSGPWVNAPNSATKASTAAFVITQASVTIGGGILILSTNTVSYGIYASSAYVTISSISVQDGSGATSKITQAGISISSWSTVSYSSVSVQAAHGFYLPGSTMTTVSYSTAAVNSSKFYALYLQGASSNTFTVFIASNPAGYGAFISTSNYNVISLSTMASGSSREAVFFNNSSSNSINRSYLWSTQDTAATLDANSNYNTISQSTMTGSGLNSTELYLHGGSYNLIRNSFISNPQGDLVLSLDNAAVYNTIQQSTITTAGGANTTVQFDNGTGNVAFNTITQSYISNVSNKAVTIQAGHDNVIDRTYLYTDGNSALYMALVAVSNTIRFSTMVSNSGSGANGVFIPANDGDSNNVFIGDYIAVINTAGGSALNIGGNFTTVIQSTLTSVSTGSGDPGLELHSSSNTISQCYIQGSTAVWLSGSTGTIINSSVLVGTNTVGAGVWLDNGGNVNLTMSSNVITGGSSGAGIYIDNNNNGTIYLTTNTILPGSQYGISIATQTTGTQIYVTSNTIVPTVMNSTSTYGIYINGLISGATIQNNSIVYRNSGTMNTRTTYGLFTASAKGLNIDHNRISNPGMLTGGSFVGAYFSQGTQQVSFKFNDVNSTGTGFTNAYLMQVVQHSTVTIRDNIFFSSFGVTGSSASFTADAASGFNSDWNLWFSSNGQNTGVWGQGSGAAHTLGANWATSSISADANSKFGDAAGTSGPKTNNPFWANPSAGAEDFHPLTQRASGRYNNGGGIANGSGDGVTSVTIDAADSAEGVASAVRLPSTNQGQEQDTNTSVPNQGSYGQTDQASWSFTCTAWTRPAACSATAGYVVNVTKLTPPTACTAQTTIQAGVRALPGNISAGNACVVIRDTQTYSEQVNIPDISMSSYTVGNNQIEILIDPSLSSGPWVNAPNSATKVSTAAFVITQASVTIGGGILVLSTNTVSYGIYASSAYVTISSISVQDGSGTNSKITQAGISISSWSTVSYSSVSVTNAFGIYIGTVTNVSVSYSTAQVNNANFYALYLNGASSSTITQAFFNNPLGDAVVFDNSATLNAISFSTMNTNGSAHSAISLLGVSTNTISRSYMSGGVNGRGASLDNTSNFNTISFSTMVANNATYVSLKFGSASSNTVTNVMMTNLGGSAAFFLNSGSAYNTISLSTMSGTKYGLDLFNGGSGNFITQSYITQAAGTQQAVFFGPSATNNTITLSTITVDVGSIPALESDGAGNTVSGSYILNPSARGVYLNGASNNTISQSTITTFSADAGLVLFTASSNTISNCYVQGSTAVWVSGSTGTVLNSNVLAATNLNSGGLWLDNLGNVNLSMSSNVITGGSTGAGVYLDVNNVGSIYLTTNTIQSAQYGIFIATQTTGTQIYVTSNTIIPTLSASATTYGIYLNGLTTGATIQNNSIVYRNSASVSPVTSFGLYGQTVTGLNIDHNRISNPGMVTGGSQVDTYFTGAAQVAFKFNDVFSTGTGFTNAYLMQLVASTVTIRDNIFFSSFGVTGSSASFKADAKSGFNSDWNLWFSSNGQNTGVWGQGSGAAHTLGANWATSSISADANSKFGKADATSGNNPFWANPSAGAEDFHPLTQRASGRYNFDGTFANGSGDGVTSVTIDAADSAEGVASAVRLPSTNQGQEQDTNTSVPNQGSYGQTDQASWSFNCPWTRPAACSATAGYVVNVTKLTPPSACTAQTTIQAGVRALPGNISAGNACVVIRDTQTYSEQVNIPDISMSSYTVGNNQIEILIDPSLSSGPWVNAPNSATKASTAAFVITQASVTIGGGILVLSTNTVSYGIYASSAYVTISSISVQDGSGTNSKITQAGISISSWSTVSYSSVSVQAARGIYADGARDSISYSTAAAASASQAALFLNGAASATVTSGYFSNSAGDGIRLWASYGTLTLSTGAASGGSKNGLDVTGSFNTISQSYFWNPTGTAAQFRLSSSYNTMSTGTVASNGTTGPAAPAFYSNGTGNAYSQLLVQNMNAASYVGFRFGAASNLETLSYSTITVGNLHGVDFDPSATLDTATVCNITTNGGGNGVNFRGTLNTVSFSTITASGGGSPDAVYFFQATSNTVASSYLFNPNTAGGAALSIDVGSAYNTVSLSTMAGTGSITSSSWNVITKDFVYALPGQTGLNAFFIDAWSLGNTVALSTITLSVAGSAAPALQVYGASNTVTQSYIYNSVSTAAWIAGSTGAIVNSNVIVAPGGSASGLYVSSGSVNLSLSSNVITGGSNSAGVYLDVNNSGSIYLTTNTFLPGSKYGIFIATQMPGTQVYVTSNTIVSTAAAGNATYGIYLNGLTTGATIQNNSIVYRQSGGGPNTYYGLYGQSVTGLNFDHNRISNPGMIISGTAVEAYFTGASQVSFKFNDVFSTGTSLTNAYLIQLVASTVTLRDNIFFSSFGVTGSSASFTADAKSGFNSDWNLWFSSNGQNTGVWGQGSGAAHTLGANWVTSSISADANSKFGDAAGTSGPKTNNPFWANPSAGVEDFHPLTQRASGRYNFDGTFANGSGDGVTSVTIDAADSAEGVASAVRLPSTNQGQEQDTNTSVPNQGSYGQTDQASWSFNCPWTRPAACSATAGYVVNVMKLTPPSACTAQTTIQAGVRALPGNISVGNACVVIRDTQTYSEQVNIPDISMSSYTLSASNRIEILIDPSLSSGPVVNPPFKSTAAFVITQASVTIGGGILIQSTNTIDYGVWISSAYVNISSVNVLDTNSKITAAGVYISSDMAAVSYSSVTAKIAYGFWLTGNRNAISYSSATAATNTALYLNGVSSNAVTVFFSSSPTSISVHLDNGAAYNTIQGSNLNSGSAGGVGALTFDAPSSYNTVTQSSITCSAQSGIQFTGSSNNTVSQSTVIANNINSEAVNFTISSSNTVTRSYLTNAGIAIGIDGASYSNTISLSTAIATADQGKGIVVQGSSTTITNSYIIGDGAAAIFVQQSTGTIINSNTLAVTGIADAVEVRDGSVNLSMSSNTIRGGSGATDAGIGLSVNNSGSIYLTTNTILAGSVYGIFIATQMPGTQVYVTSNTIVSTAASGNNVFGIFLNGLTTGATIQNNSIVLRNAGGGGGAYGLWAQSVKGLNFDHNRINNPGMIGSGGYVGAYFTGASQVAFKFNDVNSTGTALDNSNYYLIQLAGSTVTIRDNIFFSSIGFTAGGSSASFTADAKSGFNSDYNDWYSSNSYVTFAWGPTSTGTLVGMQNLFGKDSNSISANPFWQDSRSGVEDFHPQSTAGRCTGPAGDYFSACSGFATDGAQSSTIDAADPAETTTGPGGLGKEPANNGCVPNQGSTGQTGQASKSVATLSVQVSTGYYNFSASGAINLSVTASTVSVSSIVVTNNGNATESWQLSATTTTPGSIWHLGSGSPGSEQPVLNALFSSTQPVSSAFAVVNSTITNTAVTCDSTHYTGNQSCSSVAAQANSGLWFQLWSPTNTIYAVPGSSPQHIQVTVTATSLGGVCSN